MEPQKNCFERLKTRWDAQMSGIGFPLQSIFFCHRWGEDAENAGQFSGFHEALRAISKAISPVLIFGFQSEEIVRSEARASNEPAIALLDCWKGAEYLRYDVTPDELRTAAQRVIEGAKQPFPRHLLPQDPSDLLRISSEVRHWLENRRTNVTGMLDNFRGALQGERLSLFHLNSQPAISKDHQEMVNRLWAYESLAAELAHANGGIVPLRDAMDEFEQTWSGFDTARERYRLEIESGEVGKDRIESVISQLEKVIVAVRKAIEATYTLDAALKKKR